MEEIRELLKREAEAILNIPVTESFYRATDLIHNCVHVKKGKLVCSGMAFFLEFITTDDYIQVRKWAMAPPWRLIALDFIEYNHGLQRILAIARSAEPSR